MKSMEFIIWLRDEVGVIRHSKEGDKLHKPSNAELRRWVKSGAVFCNGQIISLESVIEFPIESLVLFPNNKNSRCTIV